MLNVKIKLDNIVKVVLIFLAVVAFCVPFIKGTQSTPQVFNNSMELENILGYLRFLSKDSNKVIVDLAVHNFSIAIITYILSILSAGILGAIQFCSAFFIAGNVIKTSPDVATVFFVSLELVGMSIAVFGGLFVSQKLRGHKLSFNKSIIVSLTLITIMGICYLLAAYIETGIIQKLWG